MVDRGEPIHGRFGKAEPVGAGWVYGCVVCKDRPRTVAMCKCLSDGNEYALCFPCLTAMDDLGMVEERIETYVQESGNNFTPRHSTTVNKHDLTRCPKDDGVRTAVMLARR